MPEFTTHDWVEIYHALQARFNDVMCHSEGKDSIIHINHLSEIMKKVDLKMHPWKEGMHEKEKG